MNEWNKTNKDRNDISWRIVAYVSVTVLWAISLGLLTWLCGGVSQLKQDMAVVKHVLHIDNNQVARDGSYDKVFDYDKHIQ